MSDYERTKRLFDLEIEMYREAIVNEVKSMLNYIRENGLTIKECQEVFEIIEKANLTEFIKKEGF